MDKVINKKVVLNTLDLFQNQFGWTTDEEQKSIFLDEFLFLKDFEDKVELNLNPKKLKEQIF